MAGVARARVTVIVLEAVNQRKPSRIRITPPRLEVDPGEVVQLFALAEDTSGVIIPGERLVWTLQNADAGAVTASGRFTSGSIAGVFAGAIQVKLASPNSEEESLIAASVDITVRDESDLLRKVFAVVLPQAVFVRPNEEMAFTVLALDGRGNTLRPSRTTWRLVDAAAGAVSPDGRFKAGPHQGRYPDALVVDIVLPARGGFIQARATASVTVGDALDLTGRTLAAPKAVLFPERVELGPGESFTFSIIAIDQAGRRLRSPQVRWSLSDDLGEISDTGKVTLSAAPGEYPDSVKATILLQGPDGPISQDLTASVVIRGPLARVEINQTTPSVAPRGRVQFSATAYDGNGVVITDVTFRWSVVDAAAGTISRDGLFRAGSQPGEYPNAIRVQAVQRRP